MMRLALTVLFLVGFATHACAAELLVADRLTNRVLRYSESGAFLGVLVSDSVNLSEPNGLALSPDATQLYVASRQNGRVVRYDYNGTAATNPTVLISGLNVPASLQLSADGSRLFVSNLGAAFDGATVAQFNTNGTSAGADLTGGAPAGRTGLALGPTGDLLVGSFQNGAVLRHNSSSNMFETFIGPNAALAGAGNLLVNGNDVYVAAGFSGSVMKFNATTGAPDASFSVGGLEFPASLARAPDGNGLLVGVLGLADGTGRIARYGFNGAPLGAFATSASDPALGFREATGMLVSPIPEPATLVLGATGIVAFGLALRFGRNNGSRAR
jgi:DNA-binding beta-propeller fold protein YncE